MTTEQNIEQTALLKTFDDLLSLCVEKGGSDIHLTAGQAATFRIHGELQVLEATPLSSEMLLQFCRHLLTATQLQVFEQEGQIDFGYSNADDLRFRGNIYRSMGRVCMAMRFLSNDFLSFKDLGLPEYVESLPYLKDGLVLVTGATGSGKSTTLAAVLNYINQHQNRHIITIEDPVEFVYESAKSVVHQRQLHTDVSSFSGAVRASLREDPDVILVGELRDRETVQAAISAAETGHLVFATLHTNDAVGAVDRVVGFFPGDEQGIARNRFGMCLRAVLSQRLIKSETKQSRSIAMEILHVNKAVSNLIAMDKSKQIYSVIETSRADGMQTMDQALSNLAKRGKITPKQAMAYATHPLAVEKLLRQTA